MNIHVGLITYAIDVTPLIDLAGGDDITWHIFEHSNNDLVNNAIGKLHANHRIREHQYRTNRGLARSWNEFITDAEGMGADVRLIVNDDITGTHDDLLKMAQGCTEHPECGIVTAWGFNERMGDIRDNGYSLFGINPIAIEEVGYFDVNYFVIYGEDVDYSRRCAIEGVPFHSVTETNIFHKGSATTNSVPDLAHQHQVTFPRNEAYHRLKHGGGYGKETFKFPFGDPKLSWEITVENRNNPYPNHERQDKDIVKI